MNGREKILFSSKEDKTPQEIGAFLIKLGEKLQSDGSFSLTQGEQVIEVHPQGPTRLELEYEIEGEKHEFEIEIEWKPGQEGGQVGIV